MGMERSFAVNRTLVMGNITFFFQTRHFAFPEQELSDGDKGLNSVKFSWEVT